MKKSPDPSISVRFTEISDGKQLKEWLHEPGVLRWFPMYDEVEIDDAVQRWVGFSRYRCSLTAVKDGKPVGIATLYLQPYRKLAHQCEFGIIVAAEVRNQGVGSFLIQELEVLAKSTFKIELIHLQVYESNPAKRLYARLGYKEFGNQSHWIKEVDGSFVGRTFMEKSI
jgi:RimJ/RimL family protein N-acetyltransferase